MNPTNTTYQGIKTTPTGPMAIMVKNKSLHAFDQLEVGKAIQSIQKNAAKNPENESHKIELEAFTKAQEALRTAKLVR